MKAPLYLLLVAFSSLAWVNCAGPGTTEATPTTEAMPTTHEGRSWEEWMEDVIGPGYDEVLVPQAGGDPEDMDLAKIGRTVREMAPGMALGYGPLKRDGVEGFAEFARAAEKWLLEIAAQADAGKAELVLDLIVKGGAKHCQQCHDAL